MLWISPCAATIALDRPLCSENYSGSAPVQRNLPSQGGQIALDRPLCSEMDHPRGGKLLWISPCAAKIALDRPLCSEMQPLWSETKAA